MLPLLLSALLTTLPALNFAGLEGPDLTAQQLRGRPVVLQFWASWCQSCAGVGAEVSQALAETSSSARYLAVSTDETIEAARRGAARLGHKTSPGVVYVFDRDHQASLALGDVSVPTVLVIDRNGLVVARIVGHFDAAQRGELRAALHKAAASAAPQGGS